MPGLYFCVVEREKIRAGLERGESLRQIGPQGTGMSYRGVEADRGARLRRRRSRVTKLGTDPVLRALIRKRLESKWSPAPISCWLHQFGYRVSHETIYRERYREPSALGSDTWQLLFRTRPSKRLRRRIRTGVDRQPHGQYRPITTRPPLDGPGHWEGDLLIGAANRSAAVIITERRSRLTLTGALTNQTADHVADTVCRLLSDVPPTLRKTLTWDQGRELARWKTIEQRVGIDVFFCRPRSPGRNHS